jgi:hypothetical protein
MALFVVSSLLPAAREMAGRPRKIGLEQRVYTLPIV